MAQLPVTIESLGHDDALHPLQDAFIRHDAFQCGYCTPGQLCSAAGLPTEPGLSAITDDLTADPPLTPGEIDAPRVIRLPVKEEIPCREPVGAAWRKPANCQER